MNVRELIEYLQTLSPDARVYTFADYGGDYCTKIDEVLLSENQLDYSDGRKVLIIGGF